MGTEQPVSKPTTFDTTGGATPRRPSFTCISLSLLPSSSTPDPVALPPGSVCSGATNALASAMHYHAPGAQMSLRREIARLATERHASGNE
jgi:hypothetical protein